MDGLARHAKLTQPSPVRPWLQSERILGERRLHAFGRHGKFSDAPSARMSESIRQGRRRRRKRTFAGTERRIAARHQHQVNAGNLGKR
jgi:hypothetical protein